MRAEELGAGRAERFTRGVRDPFVEGQLESAREELAGDLERRAPEILDGIRMRLARELPELGDLDDPELPRACRRACAANVHAGLAHLRAGDDAPSEAPLDVRHLARLWARRGVPSALLLRAHAVGQAAAWDDVVDAIESADHPAPLRRALTRRASHIVFGYVNGVAARALVVYEAERGEHDVSPERQRLRLVEQSLAGQDRGVALGYDMSMTHVSFVGWGAGAADVPAALSEHVGRRMLVVRPDEHSVWGWIGGFEPLTDAEHRALARMPEPSEACVAVGTEQRGLAGFRVSFEHARLGQRIGARAGRGLTHYRDVALEALAGGDEARARDFVTGELGPLAAADAKAAQLRATLQAYFAASGNASACAAALSVHEQTVAYRLRRAEDRLGHAVNSRRAELEVALRLFPLLAD